MSQLILKPKEFQGQIDKFSDGKDTIAALEYKVDASGTRLKSVDRYIECVELMNETIKLFTEMQTMDTESLKQIKAKWMHVDNDIATKTLWEMITG